MRAIIFDVDGTLVNVQRIRPTLIRTRNFTQFHEDACGEPRIFITWVLWHLAGLLGFRRIVVTARRAAFYQHTLWWLMLNGFHPDDMYMRGWNDGRPDAVIKEEILDLILERGYRVWGAVDDNPNVIAVWRRRGLFVFRIPGFKDN